jgi:tRNA 2-thiouridine synthesizing protein E
MQSTSAMQVAGRELELNNEGFLADFHAWNQEVAEAIAKEQGLELTECHWTVINFLRGYYDELEHPPSPRLIIKGIGEKLTLNAPCTRKTLDALFPQGGCKQACQIAGLPDYYCHAC